MFRSRLFASDDGLARIAEGDHGGLRELEGDAESVALLQQALLRWDPGCLPIFGPSGRLDEETVWALARFAREHLDDDVVARAESGMGPEVVAALDDVSAEWELNVGRESEVAEVDSWLTPQLSGVFSGVSTSDVTFHPTARSAYSAFSGVLDECDDERAFVVISGWDFWPETPIGPGVTIGDALRAVAQRNVRVHALINRFPVVNTLIGSFGAGVGNNTGAVNFLRSIPNSAVIHDGRALHHTPASLGVNAPGVLPIQLGVHHQKAWVVHTGQRTVAWVGGVDFNPNRTGSTPFHDVQAQLEGRAALDVYAVLRSRWQDHPDRPPTVFLPVLGVTAVTGTHRARVTATFGDPQQFAGLLGPPYLFAPQGSTATRQLLMHLIAKARSYIYVEDQYFVDPSVGAALAAAMPHLRALFVVVPDANSINGELHQAFARRRAALSPLTPHLSRVAVVNNFKRFVHSKTWIFDDIVVMTGSSNVNRRGMEHDSEMSVTAGSVSGAGTARQLREQLWRAHLGSAAPSEGSDPVAALPLFQNPPAGANVSRLDWTAGTDPQPIPLALLPLLSSNQFWTIVDPSCP
jgi:phosphatidylserine/phosphatidylglycerophosphate/cardiolipin synthase-like enzyme